MPVLSYGKSGDQYFLPKYGQMTIDLNNAQNLASAGLMYGYGLNNYISIETEFNTGIDGGEYEKRDTIGNVTETGKYEVQTFAVYSALRKSIASSAYLKAKFGILYETVKRSSDQTGELTDDSLGAAGGLGAGVFLFGSMTMEGEATLIDTDITFYSLGLHLKF